MQLTDEIVGNLANVAQFIETANKALTIPSLLILFASTFFFFLVVGLWMIRKSPQSRAKFFAIYFLTLILSAGVLVALIVLPQLVYHFIQLMLR